MPEKTTIQIDKDLKPVLDALGIKNETYNDIIKKLIEKSKISPEKPDIRFEEKIVPKDGRVTVGVQHAGQVMKYMFEE